MTLRNDVTDQARLRDSHAATCCVRAGGQAEP